MISSKGGYGMGGAYSGSGGVIVLDGFFDIPEEQVVMNGGQASVDTIDNCGNAASGTLWYRDEDRLVIDNKDVVTQRYTLVKPPPKS